MTSTMVTGRDFIANVTFISFHFLIDMKFELAFKSAYERNFSKANWLEYFGMSP